MAASFETFCRLFDALVAQGLLSEDSSFEDFEAVVAKLDEARKDG
jgi:hypothetical protein